MFQRSCSCEPIFYYPLEVNLKKHLAGCKSPTQACSNISAPYKVVHFDGAAKDNFFGCKVFSTTSYYISIDMAVKASMYWEGASAKKEKSSLIFRHEA